MLAALLAGILLSAGSAPAAPRELTPLEAAGRALYREGRSPSGGEVTAYLRGDQAGLPASALPCAGCHGDDGLGRAEGAIRPPSLRWGDLTRPGGHDHAGRRHPPFDGRSLERAVTQGIDPAGQPLDGAMPRYELPRRDLEALVAYLKVVERHRDPGLSEGSLRLGTVLPLRGRLAPVGQALRAAVEAALAEANAAGGVNGRRLELAVAGYDSEEGDGLAQARRLLDGGAVFALVSCFLPGAEGALATLAEEAGVPHVGPYTPFSPQAGGRLTFQVSPGLAELAAVLVREAAGRLGPGGGRLAVLRIEGEPYRAAASAALGEARRLGLAAVEEASPAGGPGPAELARLRGQGAEAVLLLGGDEPLAGLLREGAAAGFTPLVLAAGPLAGRAASEAPAPFHGRLLLAYPGSPRDLAPAGQARLGKLGGRHLQAQASALSAVTVLEEGLRRAGRSLSRAGLVAALEGLSELPTGLTPPVSFGPRRRVGALGGYLVAVEPGGALSPLGGWRRLE